MEKQLNMNDKKAQVEFLQGVLSEKIKAQLQEEVVYRTLTTLVMGAEKDSKEVVQQQTAVKRRLQAHMADVRHTRSLIAEIEKGSYEV